MVNAKQKAVGAALAMAVAGLAGCATNSGSNAQSSANTLAANQTDMMHCYSVNTCKGHNACKTASNACAGHGSCKGEGFVPRKYPRRGRQKAGLVPAD